MTFLVLLILPLIIALLTFWLLKTNWKGFLLQVGVQLLIAGISAVILFYSSTWDTEVWSGWVTSKNKEYTSCEHSYPCNCRELCSGSGNSKTCSTVCDTCYVHSNDWNWIVTTSNQEDITIDRVDSQGAIEPPRWSKVQILEPTAQKHSYTNYIKGAPDTLFNRQGVKQEYLGKIPSYPDTLYDYYSVDRLVTQGITMSPLHRRDWNRGLAEINSGIGAKKQVNMIVVLTDQPQDWLYALQDSWLGGKKNDAILVIGLEGLSKKATWAGVLTWTTAKIFEVKLRDAILELPIVTPETTLKVLQSNVETYYQRKPMADFEYLQASIQPSGWMLALTILIGILCACIISYLMYKSDSFKASEDR